MEGGEAKTRRAAEQQDSVGNGQRTREEKYRGKMRRGEGRGEGKERTRDKTRITGRSSGDDRNSERQKRHEFYLLLLLFPNLFEVRYDDDGN
jgi:hypothetical protein